MDSERLLFISGCAAVVARRYGRLRDVDDYVGAAYLAVVEEIRRRPDLEDCELRVLGKIIEHRLIDWDRMQRGRHHVKPHASAVYIEDLGTEDGSTIELADDVDVELAVIEADRPNGDEIVERLVFCCPDHLQDRARLICERYLDGAGMAEIANELDLTESRVSQLFAEIGDHARHHQMSPLAV